MDDYQGDEMLKEVGKLLISSEKEVMKQSRRMCSINCERSLHRQQLDMKI